MKSIYIDTATYFRKSLIKSCRPQWIELLQPQDFFWMFVLTALGIAILILGFMPPLEVE